MKPLGTGEAQARLLRKLLNESGRDVRGIYFQRKEIVGGFLGRCMWYHFSSSAGDRWRVLAETGKIEKLT